MNTNKLHEEHKDYYKNWYEKNKEKHKKNVREYYKTHKRTEYYLMKNYGITLDDYNRMFNEQNGCCKICANIHEDKKAMLVDHNHETGEVRGLICMNCNRMLGWAHDNPEILLSAIKYLEDEN